MAEVDVINNNRNADVNVTRKSGIVACQNQNRLDISHRISPIRRPQQQQQNIHDQSNAVPVDARLNDWLNAANMDPISKNAILAEQFTYDDFIYGMEKTDMHRIGLK